jgi:hypothetical protein
MTRIDEWNPVLPKKGGSPKPPDGAPAPPAGSAPDLVGAIHDKLTALRPRAAVAVHFYRGEGLRWIRVGFDGDQPLEPAAVDVAGRAIRSCIGPSEPLFFHALRPHDLLFFLEGGAAEADSLGMPAECFGAPLEDVLAAWGNTPPAAGRKQARRRA